MKSVTLSHFLDITELGGCSKFALMPSQKLQRFGAEYLRGNSSMVDRRSLHGIGGALVRRGISHHITILCPCMGHTIFPAGPMVRSGGSLVAFEMGIPAFTGGGGHLLSFPVFPACRGPPAFLVFPQKTRKAVKK